MEPAARRRRLVGRLQKPLLKDEPSRGDEVEAVVHRVAAVTAVKERVHEPGVELQVWGHGEVAAHRMLLWQQGDRFLHHEKRGLVLLEAQVAEERLQDLDADSAIVGVEHDRDHTLGP